MIFLEWMEKHDACKESINWVNSQPDQSIEALWKTCQQGDWMVWAYVRSEVPYAVRPLSYWLADKVAINTITRVKRFSPGWVPHYPKPDSVKSEEDMREIVDWLFTEYVKARHIMPVPSVNQLARAYERLEAIQRSTYQLDLWLFKEADEMTVRRNFQAEAADACRKLLPLPVFKLD